MRVLLDEQLPRQLVPHIAGHYVRTVQQQGWAGLKNGELLKQAEAAGFEIFLTADQNLFLSSPRPWQRWRNRKPVKWSACSFPCDNLPSHEKREAQAKPKK